MYEGQLLLLALFSNYYLDDYYNAIFDSNLNKLYKILGANTIEEANDLYKIIYSMDTLCDRTESSKEKIDYTYKIDLYSKVLNQMINYTQNNKDFNLENNIQMLNIVRYTLFNDISNMSSYNQQLLVELDNKYNEFLINNYNTTNEEISKYKQSTQISNELYQKFSLITPILNSIPEYAMEYNNKTLTRNVTTQP